jgi:hypothetical protein
MKGLCNNLVLPYHLCFSPKLQKLENNIVWRTKEKVDVKDIKGTWIGAPNLKDLIQMMSMVVIEPSI